MKRISFLSFFIFNSLILFSQDSLQYELNSVTVSANINQSSLLKTARNVTVITAKDIADMPVKSLDGILQYALNVDVRSRSAFGVQSDISIRGGNFDQTLIMLDGIKMNDPQTGHHSFNLPIPIDMIERIEILEGGASRVFGPSAFAGVINIITKSHNIKMHSIKLQTGENKLIGVGLQTGYQDNSKRLLVNFEKLKSDGFSYNTAFNKTNAYLRLDKNYSKGYVNFQAGNLANKFGASNFYHPKFYDQYEEIKATFGSGTWVHNYSNTINSTFNLLYRVHHDVYDFNNYFSTKPALVNFHESKVIDAEWKNRFLHKKGSSAIGFEFRSENIISNRLGKLTEKIAIKGQKNLFYDKSASRNYLSMHGEHIRKWSGAQLVFGILANYTTNYGLNIYPGADFSWFIDDNHTWYASANRSLRFPTFTELYLNTATLKADSNLLPEKANSYEIGYKIKNDKLQFNLAAFYRQTQDAIDKILSIAIPVPQMVNIDNINMLGIENELIYKIKSERKSAITQVNLNYAWLMADRHEEGFQSFYSLNYLKSKLGAGINYRFGRFVSGALKYTFKQRAGDYQLDSTTPLLAYRAVNLLDYRMNYTYKWVNLNLDINNILNYTYYEFGFVKQPGRWSSIGIKLAF